MINCIAIVKKRPSVKFVELYKNISGNISGQMFQYATSPQIGHCLSTIIQSVCQPLKIM